MTSFIDVDETTKTLGEECRMIIPDWTAFLIVLFRLFLITIQFRYCIRYQTSVLMIEMQNLPLGRRSLKTYSLHV